MLRSVLVCRCMPAGSVLPCWFDRCRRRSRTRSRRWRGPQAASEALAAILSARPVRRPVHPQAPTHSKVPGSLKARIINTATTLTATNTTGTISSSGYMTCANTQSLCTLPWMALNATSAPADCQLDVGSGEFGLSECWFCQVVQCTTDGSGCVSTPSSMVSSRTGMVSLLLKVSRA